MTVEPEVRIGDMVAGDGARDALKISNISKVSFMDILTYFFL